MIKKVSKAIAHYRAGRPEKHCALCKMFRSPDQCTTVSGRISKTALCDYFERKA